MVNWAVLGLSINWALIPMWVLLIVLRSVSTSFCEFLCTKKKIKFISRLSMLDLVYVVFYNAM